jgi:hypothetical protein
MLRNCRHGFCVAIVCSLALLPSAGAQVADINESAVRIMRQAVTPQRDHSNIGLLFALRQLRDPDLKSFFHQLAQRDDAAAQAQATLALGELDPQKKVDPWLITQLDPAAQESVIATGLDLELITADQLTELLKEERLQPMARLFLLAELVTLNEPVDQQTLIELAKSEDLHIAGLASCLLAQLGSSALFNDYCKRLDLSPPAQFEDVAIWCLEAIRRYRLKACLHWVKSLLADSPVSPDLVSRAILTLLELDALAGLEAWAKALGEEPSYQQRVRSGLLLLVAGREAPMSSYERIRGEPDEELIEAIIAMGHALSNEADPVEPLKRLIDLGHQRSSEWALSHIKKLPPQQAIQAYEFLIDRVPNPKPEQMDSTALAAQAAAKLFELKPELVLSRLQSAEDDGEKQQAILLGLFEAQSPIVGEAAAKLRRIGSGRADSLALLLMAKHARSLAPNELEQLGKIAAGGGRLSLALQIQAAWLYLKHSGQTDAALARIFAN